MESRRHGNVHVVDTRSRTIEGRLAPEQVLHGQDVPFATAVGVGRGGEALGCGGGGQRRYALQGS